MMGNELTRAWEVGWEFGARSGALDALTWSSPTAILAVIVSEFFGAPDGLGVDLAAAYGALDYTRLFATRIDQEGSRAGRPPMASRTSSVCWPSSGPGIGLPGTVRENFGTTPAAGSSTPKRFIRRTTMSRAW